MCGLYCKRKREFVILSLLDRMLCSKKRNDTYFQQHHRASQSRRDNIYVTTDCSIIQSICFLVLLQTANLPDDFLRPRWKVSHQPRLGEGESRRNAAQLFIIGKKKAAVCLYYRYQVGTACGFQLYDCRHTEGRSFLRPSAYYLQGGGFLQNLLHLATEVFLQPC